MKQMKILMLFILFQRFICKRTYAFAPSLIFNSFVK